MADILNGSNVKYLSAPSGLKLDDVLDSLRRLAVNTLKIDIDYKDYINPVIIATSSNAYLTSLVIRGDPMRSLFKEIMRKCNKT
jgi:hypothetical protein